MKNLFKNLMLVAVAAMAFTACQNDNNEINEVNRVTRYEFTANIADDTRSGFAEKEEGATAYKSEWFGNETLKLFVTDYNGYYVETTATVNTEGEFTLELENAPESFFMTVVSPAESWVSEYTANIPTEQTPLANSVDPKAHVLQSSTLPISGDSASIAMSPQGACYGKMTVNAPDFEIAKVEVSFNGGQVYTINAKNVENNVFWFAVGSMIDVSTFTVTAYDAENNAITKTVDVAAAGKTLKFQWGRVSTFSVSGLKEYVAPAAPMFTSATWTNTWAPDDKLVTFSSEELGTLQLNFYACNSESYLDLRTYTFASYGEIYPGGIYSWYKDKNGTEKYAQDGSVAVSIVDGQYYIEFNGVTDYENSYTLTATFKGEISGMDIPGDIRVKLATPNPTSVVADKTITLSWDAVPGAEKYILKLTSPDTEAFTKELTTTSYVHEASDYGLTYYFTLVASVNDGNTSYKESDIAYVSVKTPTPLPSADEIAAFDADFGATHTVEFTKVRSVSFYPNAYVFTVGDGGFTRSDDFMMLRFYDDITSADGVYTINDLNYGYCYVWLASNPAGWNDYNGYSDNYGVGFNPYHFYPNSGDTYKVLVDVDEQNPGKFTLTAYAHNASWWGALKFKGTFTGTVSGSL